MTDSYITKLLQAAEVLNKNYTLDSLAYNFLFVGAVQSLTLAFPDQENIYGDLHDAITHLIGSIDLSPVNDGGFQLDLNNEDLLHI